MTKILGSILAGLLALQLALPSLSLDEPVASIVPVVVTVAVAALAYYMKPASTP